MNRKEWAVTVTALGLMLVAGLGLKYRQAHQRLGRPGLRVVAEPTYGEKQRIISSNSAWLPPKVLEYPSEVVPVPKVVEEWLPRDTTYGHRLYRGTNGFMADCNIVLMGSDRTSIHQPQYCLVGGGWRIDRQEMLSVRMNRPHAYDLPVCRLMLSRQFKDDKGEVHLVRGLFLYWFVADGKLTANHRQMQWWIARDLLRHGVMERWGYVTCLTCCLPGQEEAAARLQEAFVTAAVPEFQLASGPPLGSVATRADERGLLPVQTEIRREGR